MSFNEQFPSFPMNVFSYSVPLLPPPPPPMMPFNRDMSPPRKRTRTTPEQLAVLEKSFNENPSPSNRIREHLSMQLGISERSIQIWFQNRRAKVKNQANKKKTTSRNQHVLPSSSTGSIDPNLYYYYYYYYFQQQQQQQREMSAPPLLAETNPAWSMPIPSDFYNQHKSERIRAHSVGPYPHYRKSIQQERHASLDPPLQSHLADPSLYYSCSIPEEEKSFAFPVSSLHIGTWKRVSDVSCQFNSTTHTLSWLLSDDQHTFRINIALHLIQYIRLTHAATMEVYINDPTQLCFFMALQGRWVQCHDFTQDKQASIEYLHVLEGSHQTLREMLRQTPDLEALLIEQEPVNTNMLLLQGLHIPKQQQEEDEE